MTFWVTHAERLSRKEIIDHLKQLNTANTFLKQHKYNEAIGLYEQVCNGLPCCAMAYFNKGLAHIFNHQEDRALICFQKTVQLDPWHAKAHYELALLLYKRAALTNARDHCKRAIDINPDFYQAHKLIKTIERHMQNY